MRNPLRENLQKDTKIPSYIRYIEAPKQLVINSPPGNHKFHLRPNNRYKYKYIIIHANSRVSKSS